MRTQDFEKPMSKLRGIFHKAPPFPMGSFPKTSWQEEFDLRVKNWREDLEFWRSDMKDFISTLIEQIIDDIPTLINGYSVSEPTQTRTVQDLGKIKQQLRKKWLGKEQE